eukprot:3381149-Amphidinium_carterae.1
MSPAVLAQCTTALSAFRPKLQHCRVHQQSLPLSSQKCASPNFWGHDESQARPKGVEQYQLR